MGNKRRHTEITADTVITRASTGLEANRRQNRGQEPKEGSIYTRVLHIYINLFFYYLYRESPHSRRAITGDRKVSVYSIFSQVPA